MTIALATNGLYPVGTRIYYTGDMANQSGEGVVIAHREGGNWGDSMDIRFDDGRDDSRALPMACFRPGPGRRFYPMVEWQAKREAEIAQMKAEYEAFLARQEAGR